MLNSKSFPNMHQMLFIILYTYKKICTSQKSQRELLLQHFISESKASPFAHQENGLSGKIIGLE